MNKKLFYAMSRRRVSCPQMTQQLWDAIKTIRYQRQVPDIDRIAKFMSRVHNVGLEEVTRQLNYCVRDGLLQLTKRVGFKGSKIGVETEGYNLPGETVEKDSHDWYCFECHRGGDVISCNTCHRVYHLACIAKEELPETDVKHKFVCNVCKMISTKEENFEVKKSQLNRLLRLTIRRLKQRLPMSLTERHVLCNASATPYIYERQGNIRRPSSELPSTIKWVNDDKDIWRQDFLLYRPMDLQMMEAKAQANKYEHLEEFKADAQTIVHNVVIYHGVHSIVADHARLMLRDCLTSLQDIRQCRDCYKVSFERNNRNWFCKPCRPPHMLVYAKQKGYPYWPAKVIKINGDLYDVRFFGGTHERTSVEKAYIRPISININSLQVKKTSSWNKACEELKRHQDLLEKLRLATNNFTAPAQDSSSDSSDNDTENEDEDVEPPKMERERERERSSERERVKLESDMSDLSEDDEEAPLMKRLKREEEPVIIPVAKKFQKIPSKSLPSSVAKTPSGKRRGRPPLALAKRLGRKALSVSPVKRPLRSTPPPNKTPGRRGRPPGSKNKDSLIKKEIIEMQRKLEKEFEEKKRKKDEEELRKKLEEDSKENIVKLDLDDPLPKLEEKVEISSTSVPLVASKKEEEEMVSSSCQEPQVRSVAVQTKPQPTPEPKKTVPETSSQPSEEQIAKIREEVVEEKDKEIEKLKTEHAAEIASLEEKHKLYVTEIKKKQWCYNCESEAIYHCCWNTAYCSIDCQQLHWQKEHKRVCRRKR
ncbi:zinc finger MYND domain-containing protein 11 isoform X2 [Macrosteles quadrilineatus]|uniref:zinc finger MYND domain-containing protein 11 isoform X2 n=1 Tax=Macrosteles quadrilineatus TaxID=74068 RepID=UPI0023E0C666|nr:zinc finger MYND domain-containing protein 11 isoform X2 [Macrosteles quadrilineatus]